MKKADYLFYEQTNENYSTAQFDEIIRLVKLAQEDAIRETVKKCAESVKVDFKLIDAKIQLDSILSVADKLIKEL
jgi:hypothetical protein